MNVEIPEIENGKDFWIGFKFALIVLDSLETFTDPEKLYSQLKAMSEGSLTILPIAADMRNDLKKRGVDIPPELEAQWAVLDSDRKTKDNAYAKMAGVILQYMKPPA